MSCLSRVALQFGIILEAVGHMCIPPPRPNSPQQLNSQDPDYYFSSATNYTSLIDIRPLNMPDVYSRSGNYSLTNQKKAKSTLVETWE